MQRENELSGIDLVWWPALLRAGWDAPRRKEDRFTACLMNLAQALATDED